jgi:hypothetical protein
MLMTTTSDGVEEVALFSDQPHHLINQMMLLVIPSSISHPK